MSGTGETMSSETVTAMSRLAYIDARALDLFKRSPERGSQMSQIWNLTETIRGVLNVHHVRIMNEMRICDECIRGNGSCVPYPCPTIRAITATLKARP